MRIDNNYTQYRQPNFGRLKSIKYNNIYPDVTQKKLQIFCELLKSPKLSMNFSTNMI